MVTINIPKKDLPVFDKMLEMDDQQFKSMLAAIEGTKPSVVRREFVQNVSKQVKTIPAKDTGSILRVLFILHLMKQKSETSSIELADEICLSLNQITLKEKDGEQMSQEQKKILSGRLKQLLDCKTLTITAKALDVMTAQERIYCNGRILSDIRPIFANGSKEAAAAVIIHTLEIGFHQDGEHRDFHVALDMQDILDIKQVIKRAEEKTIALQSILEKSKTVYLET